MVSATRMILRVCVRSSQSSARHRIGAHAFQSVWLRSLIRGPHIHTHSHVQYSAFSLTYVQFNFFRSAVCCIHFCLFRFSKRKKKLSAWMCIFLFFLRSFYPFHHVSRRALLTRAHTTSSRWSSYSLCLSAVLCFVFISLNWFAARFFWMNWANGVSCIMHVCLVHNAKKWVDFMNFHFI